MYKTIVISDMHIATKDPMYLTKFRFEGDVPISYIIDV